MNKHNQEEIKEEIRRNIILLAILLILASVFITRTILVKPTQENKYITRITLINKCIDFCETKGLMFSNIDEAGIGYTSRTEGRCICLNKSMINNQTK